MLEKLFVKPNLTFYNRENDLYPLSLISTVDRRLHTIVTAPTGAGKTRIAVEAYTEYLRPRFYEGKFLIWIAQSEEL